MKQNRTHHGRRRVFLGGCLAVLTGLLAIGLAFFILNRFPKIAALGADELRNIIGDQQVARLETAVLQAEDWMHQWRYKVAKEPSQAPWSNEPPPSNSTASNSTDQNLPKPSTTTNPPNTKNSGKDSSPVRIPDVPATKIPADRSQLLTNLEKIIGVSSGAWSLPPIPPMGNMNGEGTWQPYLRDSTGRVVAERAFLQPDPQRPYAVVAIVALDLQNTRLHFVLGTTEPKSAVSMPRPGTIPSADMTSVVLLAAFNGGFRAQDGHFGTEVNGVTLIPLRDGLGTVAIYADGTVKIGEWGTDVTQKSNQVILRQNGPLMIHNGQISPNIADNNPQEWGYTLGGKVATYRSALGISKDGRTLYYAAGGGLTRPELADALLAAGVYHAVQLDINDYWVHFDSFQFVGNKVLPQPLLRAMGSEDDQRYVKGFTRDFFYVTTAPLTTTGK